MYFFQGLAPVEMAVPVPPTANVDQTAHASDGV